MWWPKHCNRVHLLSEAALTIFAPLSVVMHTCLLSFRPHQISASVRFCAINSPVWSSGKYAVSKHLLFRFQSPSMKCTLKLMYGSHVRLVHMSVVVAKYEMVDSSFSTACLHSEYIFGIAVFVKYLQPGTT